MYNRYLGTVTNRVREFKEDSDGKFTMSLNSTASNSAILWRISSSDGDFFDFFTACFFAGAILAGLKSGAGEGEREGSSSGRRLAMKKC
jgi:hypothetical protein